MCYPVVPAPFVEETILFPLAGFGTFVDIQLAIDVQVYFWTVGLFISVFIVVPHCFD